MRARSAVSSLTALGVVVMLSLPQVAHAEDVPRTPFLGDGYRWSDRDLFTRIGFDLVAIPANLPSWEPLDWVQFAGFGAAVGGLMFAGTPSPDVRLDRFIAQRLDRHLPEVWTPAMQVVLWGSVGVGGLGAWALGHAIGNETLAEGASLMIESVAVAQAYHLTLKLLIGREGPMQGNGEGRVLGPLASFGLLPAGTPSGHAATLFAVAASGLAYFAPPVWVQVAGWGLTGSLIAFHVLDRRHFVSESLWGAALGASVGTWVVRHRASLPAEMTPGRGTSAGVKGSGGAAWAVMPLALPGGGGLAASGQF